MISIRNLSKEWGGFGLRDINLEIKGNEYFIIMGPTGVGKTLLLECVAGLHYPDRGRVFIGNRDVTDVPPEKRNIGFVYQDYLLFPNMNIWDNIKFGLRFKNFSKNEIDEKIKKVSELLQIAHLLDRNPKNLSGGEQQRVALARALVIEPKALLLDETLSALDPGIRGILQEELREIHKKIKTTTIHVTHNFEEAISLADRIAVMSNGEILQVGKPEGIFRKPISEFVANFTGVENIFSGISQIEGDIAKIKIDNIQIYAITQKTGNVRFSIRPEEITMWLSPEGAQTYVREALPLGHISKTIFGSSARNTFRGKILGIADRGPLVRMVVDIGIPLAVLITRGSYEGMRLSPDTYVYVSFKASGVHVF